MGTHVLNLPYVSDLALTARVFKRCEMGGRTTFSRKGLIAVSEETADDGSPSKQEVTPLPGRAALTATLVQTCEGFQITVLFPFVVFMCRDFGIDQTELGLYSGLLASCFPFAQFLSSIMWGRLSDRFGRKPAILAGLLGTCSATLCFGLSTTYGMAFASRFAGGLLNGNIGVLKSFLADVTDHTNRAKAFSYIGLGWGIGSILGPAFGGLFARPTEVYPDTFPSDGLFGTYPYLLPCLGVCTIGIIVFFFALFFMVEPETEEFGAGVGVSVATKVPGSALVNSGGAGQGAKRTERKLQGEMYRKLGKDEATGDLEMLPVVTEEAPSPLSEPVVDPTFMHEAMQPAGENAARESAGHDAQEEMGLESGNDSNPPDQSLFRSPPVLLSVGSYGGVAFCWMVFDELYPVFCQLPRSLGGLGLDSFTIGLTLTCGGAALLLITGVICPLVVRHIPPLTMYRMGTIGSIPYFICFPIVALAVVNSISTSDSVHSSGLNNSDTNSSNLGRPEPALTVFLIAVQSLKQVVAFASFTAVMVMISNSARSDQQGAVNGFGQSVASLARCIGPAAGGGLWTLSLRAGLPHFQLVAYGSISGVCLILVIVSYVAMTSKLNGAATDWHLSALKTCDPLH